MRKQVLALMAGVSFGVAAMLGGAAATATAATITAPHVTLTPTPAAPADVSTVPADDVTPAPAPAADPIVTPLPDTPTPLTAEQLNAVLAYALTLIGAALVRPVTALLQSWRVTASISPQTISALLSLAFVTGLGWYQGVYGPGVKGVLAGAAAGLAAWLYSYGRNRAASLSAEGGTRRAYLGKATNAIGDTSTRAGLAADPVPEAFPRMVAEVTPEGGAVILKPGPGPQPQNEPARHIVGGKRQE